MLVHTYRFLFCNLLYIVGLYLAIKVNPQVGAFIMLIGGVAMRYGVEVK